MRISSEQADIKFKNIMRSKMAIKNNFSVTIKLEMPLPRWFFFSFMDYKTKKINARVLSDCIIMIRPNLDPLNPTNQFTEQI